MLNYVPDDCRYDINDNLGQDHNNHLIISFLAKGRITLREFRVAKRIIPSVPHSVNLITRNKNLVTEVGPCWNMFI